MPELPLQVTRTWRHIGTLPCAVSSNGALTFSGLQRLTNPTSLMPSETMTRLPVRNIGVHSRPTESRSSA